MSGIPQEIPDFGSAQLTPRQNPKFAPGPTFTTEDYFVWSRMDGHTSLRDIILMLGFGAERAIEILRRLRRSGAVLLPGEDPDAVAVAPPPSVAAPPPGRDTDEPPPAPDFFGPLRPEEERAMAEPVQLQPSEKRRIIEMMRLVEAGDYFAVLGVPRDVDRRELKRAYFRVSKEFHPDRHYGHALGSFGPWLSRIFETATRAFQVLSDPARRAEHLAELEGGPKAATAARGSGGQTRAEHAAELFQRACDAEVSGDRDGALRLFSAAVRVSPNPRYLRRAARCALACGRLSEAEEYAKKAASLRSDDASYARVLADVYRAARKLAEAEEILIRALELPSASDILVREIQSDLAAVRAARAAE